MISHYEPTGVGSMTFNIVKQNTTTTYQYNSFLRFLYTLDKVDIRASLGCVTTYTVSIYIELSQYRYSIALLALIFTKCHQPTFDCYIVTSKTQIQFSIQFFQLTFLAIGNHIQHSTFACNLFMYRIRQVLSFWTFRLIVIDPISSIKIPTLLIHYFSIALVVGGCCWVLNGNLSTFIYQMLNGTLAINKLHISFLLRTRALPTLLLFHLVETYLCTVVLPFAPLERCNSISI